MARADAVVQRSPICESDRNSQIFLIPFFLLADVLRVWKLIKCKLLDE